MGQKFGTGKVMRRAIFYLVVISFYTCESKTTTTCANSINIFGIEPGMFQSDLETVLNNHKIGLGGEDQLLNSTRYFHYDSILEQDTINYTYYIEFKTGVLTKVSIEAVAGNSKVLENITRNMISGCFPASKPYDKDILLYEKVGGRIHSMTTIVPQLNNKFLVMYTIY